MIDKVLKKIALFFVILVSVLSAGCTGPAAFYDSENESITLIMKYMTRDYRDEIISGARTAASEYGIDLIIQFLSSSDDPSRQADMINTAIESGTDAVILAAEETAELEEAITDKLNVPMILIDTEWAKKDAFCSIATDNRQMAKDVTARLRKAAGDECTVYILNSVCPSGGTKDKEAFLSAELAEHPGIIVKTINYNTEIQTKLKSAIEYGLNEASRKRAVIALDGFSSISAVLAIKEQNKKIPLIAFGSSLDLVSETENGIVDSMVVENAFTKGYISVQNAVEAVKEGAVPEDILLKARIVTLGTLYLPENQKLIFPLT